MSVAELLQKKKEALAEKNLIEGKLFLAENAKKTGVITLESGLQYQIINFKDGKKPLITDIIRCNYIGKNLNNEIFDSSEKNGKPSDFKIQKLIQGYQQALPLMTVGSKWKLFIPSELAYKDQHKSKEIGANSTLIFEVELLEIL